MKPAAYLSFLMLVLSGALVAKPVHPYQTVFVEAAKAYQLPLGLLEAVSYTNTRMQHLTPNETESCMGLPKYLGLMGLVADGKSYFKNNLSSVSQLSGISTDSIAQYPAVNVMAYAKALQLLAGSHPNEPAAYMKALVALSEFPKNDSLLNDFAVNSWLYGIYSFLANGNMQRDYSFPNYQINLPSLFGSNYNILSAPQVLASPQGIYGNGQAYQRSGRSMDYGPAIWDAAATCNYSTRGGVAVSAVTIHTVQGSYAGAISWFKNCSAQVSAHYVIRSSDGQVTQMVAESNKAWHVGSENPYTIGIEHEGYVNNPAWYTTAMYQSSASLVKDICQSGYGINPLSCYKGTSQSVLSSCYRIKGHVHYPNQTHTDPGGNWNWAYYYSLINDSISNTRLTACTGTITDNGGTGNYLDLSTYTTTIAPPGAISLSLQFASFSLENGFDSLYLFDGPNINSPLIGGYTGTNSPGTATASSGIITLLFKSDCSVNSWGFSANWACTTCPGSLTISTQVSNALCYNSSTGTASVIAQGGKMPYSYQWSTGSTGNQVNNLAAGVYYITVTDGNGCRLSDTVVVAQPSPLSVNLNGTNPTCFGLADGSITSTVSGGVGNYSYAWSNGQTTASITNLTAGNYRLTVTDSNNCTYIAADTLTSPPLLTGLITKQDALCYGDSSGSIGLTVTGGTSPYRYQWSNGSNANSITSLAAGIYSVSISDTNNCQLTLSDTLSSPSLLSVQLSKTSPACFGDSNGQMVAMAMGGVSPYSYHWSSNDTGSTLANLAAGTYAITVIDANGCEGFALDTLTAPDILLVSLLSTAPSCSGQPDGAIAASVSGGTMPYQFAWSNNDTTNAIDSLTGGIYQLTITDAHACSTVAADTLTDISGLSLVLDIENLPTCAGFADGVIRAVAISGAPPYQYQWSNQAQQALVAVPAGNYQATVTDANGCSSQASISIPDRMPLQANHTAIPVSCADGSDGSIDIAVNGGLSPYTINWQLGTQFSANQVAAGSYYYVITDSNGCELSGTVMVEEPQPLSIAEVDIHNGTISIDSISGGTPPYHYEWSNGTIGSSLLALESGEYRLTVLDSLGCQLQASYQIQLTATALPSLANAFQFLQLPGKQLLVSSQVEWNMNVFSMEGKLLMHQQLQRGDNVVDVSWLPNSMYIAKLYQQGSVHSIKLMLY
ncbi:MAG: N-acetylmuramoyl-L-alanine amidase [Chitinophagales bacterium]|nr:N-acetylmuramoyl-L-alanine amidase [Chitinophagales bacterium]